MKDANGTDQQAPGMGHNDPPEEITTVVGASVISSPSAEQTRQDVINYATDPAVILDALADATKDMAKRTDELIAANDRVPATIDDAENETRIIDYIRMLNAGIKDVEGRRKAAKDPYIMAGKAVDGYFKRKSDELARIKSSANGKLTDYQRRKAEEERVRRMEQERLAREDAERKRLAEEARLKAERERQEVEEARLEAERERLREEGVLEAELEEVAPVPPEVEDEHTAEAAAEVHAADQRAEDAAKDAKAGAAERSRGRGEFGAVGSLRTTWDFEIEDPSAIPLATLRAYIGTDCLEKAVRGYVKQGGRELKGVRIFERHHSVVS